MTRVWALFACIPFVATVSACGKRDRGDANATGSEAHTTTTPPPTPPPPPIDAPDTPAIDVSYSLPPANTVARLPSKPDAYVFVYGYGKMRVGASPSLAAATEVFDVASLTALLPPTQTAMAATGDIGAGKGAASGFAIGGGGTYVAYSLRGGRTDPAAARIVLVADRQASIELIGKVVSAIHEPVAVAVTGKPSDGALAVTLEAGSPSDGAQYLVTMSTLESDIFDTSTGADPTHVANTDLEKSLAALDANATVSVQVWLSSMFFELVMGLDAAARFHHPIPITVRAAGSGMRGRNDPVPQVRIGQPNTVGDLDKAIIRRYIKRNIQKILYCYEKELPAKADLQGTVTTEFVIGPDGHVPQVKATGINMTVANCIALIIKDIEFPPPKSGIVKISYPFTFYPAGG